MNTFLQSDAVLRASDAVSGSAGLWRRSAPGFGSEAPCFNTLVLLQHRASIPWYCCSAALRSAAAPCGWGYASFQAAGTAWAGSLSAGAFTLSRRRCSRHACSFTVCSSAPSCFTTLLHRAPWCLCFIAFGSVPVLLRLFSISSTSLRLFGDVLYRVVWPGVPLRLRRW